MSLLENIRLAFEGLKANKMRALLTMLGIIIGIAAVIGILTVGDALSGTITGTMSSFGASSITVTLQKTHSLTEELNVASFMAAPEDQDLMTEEMLDKMMEKYGSQIQALSLSESVGSGQAKDGRLYANVSVTGVNPDYFVAGDIDLSAGRFLLDKDLDGRRNVCVVSSRLVNNMFSGDEQSAIGAELAVTVNREIQRFRVVGVYTYEQTPYSFTTASEKDASTALYIPVTTAKHILGAAEGYANVTVMANDNADSAALSYEIQSFLNRFYRNNDDYHVAAFSMDSIIESVDSIMGKLAVAISVIAAISLLVGGIGVMNIMLVSVTERTREIGTRKAMGATNNNIRIQFVVESMIVCLIGGVIGILLGGVLGYVGSSLLSAPTLPGFGSIALAVGFSLAVGIFFGYYPANKAAKLDPIEALRYE